MPEWTKEQKRAIETDRRNLLVSAAAGSGKTAVLVERILQKLMRRDHPINVTSLLVVTFTRAAAAEMRERVQKELLKALTKIDEWTADWSAEERRIMKRHLKKQTLLMEQANISTIDSFCAGILRNYFHVIDMDPGTRLAGDDEIEIIKSDELKKLLEEEYAKEDSKIGFLSDYLGSSKTTDSLEDAILSLYKFSRNSVSPERALEGYLAPYRLTSVEELRAAEWNRDYLESMKKWLSGAESYAEALVAMSSAPGGTEHLLDMAKSELQSIRAAAEAKDYNEFRQKIGFEFISLPRHTKKCACTKEDHARGKALRDAYKSIVTSLASRASWTEEEILEEFRIARPAAEELIRLTKAFAERFAAEKKRLRMMDFNDQEHFVLDVLTENGAPSDVAKSLTDDFDEIMIDEYQDSNELQEAILTSFARRDSATGEPVNVFMVGDIKQSIYRFREANPDLFNEKYKQYATMTNAPEAEKVELSANFRSRLGVTDAVNFFFKKWMREDVGGVEYTKEAYLNPKGRFPETDLPVGNDTVIRLVDPEDDTRSLDPDVAEAHMIASEIKRITDEDGGIYVKADDDHVRKATYKDVVILLRSLKDGDVLQDVLESYGIPSYMKRKAGFYETFEVQFAVHYLTVIDNPHDEVALTAVLRSPIVGLTSEDLARMVAGTKRKTRASYLAVLKEYADRETDAAAEKLKRFFTTLERFRILAGEMKLSMLLRTMFRETGLLLFVNALPGGDQRLANLNELVEKAAKFEETSLIGVFNFIRYLKRNRERSDEGEVGTVGENENLVRIMTIHSSKGLEFPIVFVSNLDKNMNVKDEQKVILKHGRLGIGLKVVQPELRIIRKTTFYREVMKDTMHREMLGEELRVFYVAMTRAKEKLYLTGALKNSTAKLEELEETFRSGGEKLSFNEVASAGSYLKLLLSAYRYGSPVKFSKVVTPSDLSLEEVEEAEARYLKREVMQAELSRSVLPLAAKELRELLGFDYHIDDLSEVYSTFSVSALKRAMTPEFERPFRQHAYVKDDRESGGAERGTLYHRVMELIDPEKTAEEALSTLKKEGLISEAEEGKIDVEDIQGFLDSPLGKRMTEAHRNGRAFREKQFIVGRPAAEISPGSKIRNKDELVMVQGVIDLYFEEEDGLVLVDYKTDRIADEERLIQEYRVQIDLYEKALTMITGKPVKEKWIYSFALRKGILI